MTHEFSKTPIGITGVLKTLLIDHAPRWCAPLFLFALYSMSCSACYADISRYYFGVSCDAERGVAAIRSYIVFNDDAPPPETQPVSVLLAGKSKNTRKQVCRLGVKRSIFLDATLSEDHPRDNSINIYTGTRPTHLYLVVADGAGAYVQRLPEPYKMQIKLCNDKNNCAVNIRTDPSFNCSNRVNVIDNIICYDDDLSNLDATIFGVSNINSDGRISISKGAKARRIWRRDVAKKCGVPATIQAWWNTVDQKRNIIHCIDGEYRRELPGSSR